MPVSGKTKMNLMPVSEKTNLGADAPVVVDKPDS